MIDVKVIKKPKSSGGTTTGNAGVPLKNGTVDEARRAAKADLATFAEQSEYAERAGYASRAAYADTAGALGEDVLSYIKETFLSKLSRHSPRAHHLFEGHRL